MPAKHQANKANKCDTAGNSFKIEVKKKQYNQLCVIPKTGWLYSLEGSLWFRITHKLFDLWSSREGILWSSKIRHTLWIKQHEVLLCFLFFPPLPWYRLSGWELPSWITLLYTRAALCVFEDAHFYLWQWGPLAKHFELDYNLLTVIIEFWQMFKATGLHIKALSFVG